MEYIKKINMRNLIKITLMSGLVILSCSEDSVSDEFNNANGNIEAKLMESISVVSAQDSEENATITFSYTSNGKLNTISDGTDTNIFVYDDNNELSNITGAGENLNIEELYQSPYDAFETGNVVEYDNNNNPKKIEFFEEGEIYDPNTNSFIYTTVVYTADVSYDSNHNPYFHTLQSGGVIDVLDNVELNFSMTPQVPEIVQARRLFPVNNPSQIIYKNEQGQIMYTINANYSYDNENYATSATIVSIDIERNEQNTYSVVYQYIN